LAKFAAIRRTSSLVSRLVAEQCEADMSGVGGKPEVRGHPRNDVNDPVASITALQRYFRSWGRSGYCADIVNVSSLTRQTDLTYVNTRKIRAAFYGNVREP